MEIFLMLDNEPKCTSLSSITLLILKELRLERNIHQAQLADNCDKTPSAWTKIETGKTPLTIEVFFRVCNGLAVSPSTILATAEQYTALLSQNNWGVMSKQLDFSEDTLLKEAQEYYSSPGYRSRMSNVVFGYNTSILNGPIYNQNGATTPADVFLYALNKSFKQSQNIDHQAVLMNA